MTLSAGSGAAQAALQTNLEVVPRISMRGIKKRFGSIEALRGVDLDLMPGECLGLVGDNAAGKSTLTKVLSGAYVADEGTIAIEGAPAIYRTPAEARHQRIEMVYQDLSLCDTIDVARAAAFDPRVLIMDEPTSALAVAEVEAVLALIQRLKGRGVSVVLITHRLQDLFRVCDRIAVMYEGTKVAERPIAQTDLTEIVKLIVGERHVAKRGTAS